MLKLLMTWPTDARLAGLVLLYLVRAARQTPSYCAAPPYRVGGGRPMNTRRIRSTAPLSSARLIDVDDLPDRSYRHRTKHAAGRPHQRHGGGPAASRRGTTTHGGFEGGPWPAGSHHPSTVISLPIETAQPHETDNLYIRYATYSLDEYKASDILGVFCRVVSLRVGASASRRWLDLKL